MTDGENKSLNWGMISLIIGLLAVIIGIVYYYMTNDIITAILLIILVIGIYLILASFGKSKQLDQFGTSESGASAVIGFFVTAIGLAGLVFFHSGILLAIVAFIAVIIVYLVFAMATKKK